MPEPESMTERDTDAERKRIRRSKAAEITIPECVNPKRREACLADPERFLRTYHQKKYKQPFGRIHRRMIQAIEDRAILGGKKAIAAPRSRGKSTIVKGMNVYLVAKQLVRFIVPICATTKLAGRIYTDFRHEWAKNELLLEDFPEICAPVRALEGAPQRASRQHIAGHLTNIVWTATDYLNLPRVPGNANDYLRSMGVEWSPYGGVKMTFGGLDAALRGLNIDDDRPDYIIIDDPETRESAKSEDQIKDRIEIIRKDIEGLEGQDKLLAITMITTVQNRISLSYQFTDPEIEPAWDGERFGWIEKWPDNAELWEEYISVRRAAQTNGDRHGLPAVQFYLDNREAMDAGVVMLAENYKEVVLQDGTVVVHSAIQEAYNKIAGTSLDAFKAEYQNDPPETEAPETLALTAGKVASRLSGYLQGEIPPDTEHITIGLDIGKYYSHWCKVAWWGNAVGHIIDYGVMETPGMSTATDNKSVMSALVPALLQWRIDMLADGKLDFCFVDSGDYTDAVYEFVRQVGGVPFAASKGWDRGRFHMGKDTDTRRHFVETYASHQPAEKIWLYNVNTEYWKQWTHERFATATRDENEQFNDGSLSLFSAPGDRKKHLSFSHHIVAEERVEVFESGKGIKRVWKQHNKNNHWLDAVALACAAAACLGVRLVPRTVQTPIIVAKPKAEPKPFLAPNGRPFLATERR